MTDDHAGGGNPPRDLEARLGALSESKRRLLERWQKGEGGAPVASEVPADPEEVPADPKEVPASYAQQRLWFLDRFAPGSPAYNLPVGFRLRGPLDHSSLERTFREVVRRHEALRTTFRDGETGPVQVVRPAGPIPVPVTEVTAPGPTGPAGPVGEDLPDLLARLAREEAQAGFDLETGPLIRARLFRLAEEDHLLVLTVHHIVADGWSWGILAGELSRLYEAYRNSRPSPLPEIEVQYRDFTLWQRQRLSGERLESELRYWRERLGGDLPVVELPTDRPRPAVQGMEGALLTRRLAPELEERVQTLARAEGATPFMVLLAAFKALVSRYTGLVDLPVGTPTANRTRTAFEGLIGFFVNTLTLRTDLSGDPSFREVVRRVRLVTMDAYSHQELPFERLVSELSRRRDMSHTPLFQLLFVLQNTPLGVLELDGLTVTPFPIDIGTAKFDLSLTLEPTAEGLEMIAEYAVGLFDEATVARFLGHYETLLGAATTSPDLTLSRLPIVTAAEDREVRAWNRAAAPRGVGPELLHELFEETARRAPDAPAVSGGGGEDGSDDGAGGGGGRGITYGALNDRADQLAARLAAAGVGADTVVGVFIDRSVEMVVALLGVLKAGGAYLPLDPSHPPSRLGYILADSGVKVMVTRAALADELAAVVDPAGDPAAVGDPAAMMAAAGMVASPLAPSVAPRIVLVDPGDGDGDWNGDRDGDRNPLPKRVAGPDNLAYVMYTSGSTGRPKGVALPHRGIVERLRAMQDAYHLGPGDRFLFSTTFTFDISLYEIFWPLAAGAEIVPAPPGVPLDPAALARFMLREKVTRAQFVPSQLSRLLAEPDFGRCTSLQDVFAIGEPLPPETVRRFLAVGLAAPMSNVYGPTEATVHATTWPCPASGDLGAVLIGRPAANTQAWVLGPAPGRDLLPVGLPGEIYLGGAGLARGYLGRSDLTAEVFVPDHLGPEPGARLYRTGDLGRLRPGGEIEFLGRRDDQVKIRGFRVELGEIEAALVEHPAVREAAVVVRGEENSRLIAYVSLDTDVTAPHQVFRDHLRTRLPDYMVPAVFVVLDGLPVGASGKVDRRALPDSGAGRPETETAYAAPRTETEKGIAAIWARVLELERVGVEDDFFVLGGHSLLATQVLSRVANAYGVTIPVLAFFEAPTVAELAAAVEAETAAGGGRASPTDGPRGRLRPEDVENLSEDDIDSLLREIAEGK